MDFNVVTVSPLFELVGQRFNGEEVSRELYWQDLKNEKVGNFIFIDDIGGDTDLMIDEFIKVLHKDGETGSVLCMVISEEHIKNENGDIVKVNTISKSLVYFRTEQEAFQETDLDYSLYA